MACVFGEVFSDTRVVRLAHGADRDDRGDNGVNIGETGGDWSVLVDDENTLIKRLWKPGELGTELFSVPSSAPPEGLRDEDGIVVHSKDLRVPCRTRLEVGDFPEAGCSVN